MTLKITGKQIEISKAFREYVEDKYNHLMEKYKVNQKDGSLTIHNSNNIFHSEVSVHIGRRTFIRCKGEGSDAYKCVDNTMETMEKRLRRHNRRLNDHHRKHDVHVEPQIAPSYVLDIDNEPDNHTSEDLAPPIIAEMKHEINTLTVGEAVLRMDLGNENPYIFKNSSHGRVNVVYRRDDGNIGWVDIPKE